MKQYFRIYKLIDSERYYLEDWEGESHTKEPDKACVFNELDYPWWEGADWLHVEPLPEDEQMRLNGAPMLL